MTQRAGRRVGQRDTHRQVLGLRRRRRLAERRLEHLHAAVETVGDVDPAVAIDGDALRKSKLALLDAFAAEPPNQRAVRLEYRHPVVGLFGDVQPLRLVDGHAHGVANRRRRHGEFPKLSGRAEDLDPIAKRIGHIHQARRADGDSIGRAELSRLLTAAAPHGDERAVRPKLLHAVVEAVGNVDEAVGVDRDAARRVELALTAALAAPLAAKLAVPRKDLDASIAPVDHVEQPVGS